MPACGRGLKALVFLVGEFEEKHQSVREGHERMFPYEDRGSAFDDPAAAALECAEAAELSHVCEISLGPEGRRHSCEVADRRDFWLHSASERLSPGCASEVVVALCSGRGRDDLQLAVVRHELDHRLVERGRLEMFEFLSAPMLRLDLLQRLVQPSQVVAS